MKKNKLAPKKAGNIKHGITKTSRSPVVMITGRYIPRYQSEQSAGCDLCAKVPRPMTVMPGAIAVVPTGIRIALPRGYEAQVRPRSGLAKDYGIGIMNTPGTIDADYRGEVKVILFNFGKRPFTIRQRDRIAQMVFCQVEQAHFKPVKKLRSTRRGRGGFGHSGIKGRS